MEKNISNDKIDLMTDCIDSIVFLLISFLIDRVITPLGFEYYYVFLLSCMRSLFYKLDVNETGGYHRPLTDSFS